MWNDRGHLNIHLNNDTVIYKEAAQPSNIGVIIISDTMGNFECYLIKKGITCLGSELRGSRQSMELFAEKGFNVVKPMLYEKVKLVKQIQRLVLTSEPNRLSTAARTLSYKS